MIGTLDWDIRAADTTLPVTGGNISIDEVNVPAIAGSILVPYDQAVFDALDPRQTPVPRILLTGTYSEWSSLPISAMTRSISGAATLADISLAWSGLTLGDLTARFGAPLSVDATAAPVTMSLDVHVREISADDFDMVISFASDEALLTDWAPTDGLDFAAIGEYQEGISDQHARKWVDPLLQLVLGRRADVNAYSTAELSSPYGEVINRSLDMTAWEMIVQPLNDANLKLRVNRDGAGFTLQDPTNEIPGKQWDATFTSEQVVTARRVRSRTGEWYDSVSMMAGDNIATRVYKGGPTGRHSRTYTESHPEGYRLTSAMVRNIVARNLNRGQFIDITAPIRLGVFMMDEFTYAPDDGPIQPWRVQAVSYDLTAHTMNVRGVERY